MKNHRPISSKTPEEIAHMLGVVTSYSSYRITRDNYISPYTHILSYISNREISELKNKLKNIGAKYILEAGRSNYKYIKFRLEADDDEINMLAEKKRKEDERNAKIAKINEQITQAKVQAGLSTDIQDYCIRAERFLNGALDLNKLNSYYCDPIQPTNKDERRIYDIIRKSQVEGTNRFCIAFADAWKMRTLAEQMNTKIKDEAKRFYRAQACEKYGLLFLAKSFQPNENDV